MSQMKRISKNNTSILSTNGLTSIILHGTEVVRYDERKIILNSGGWQTVTTKARMNQTSNERALGYQVYSKKGSWVVLFKGVELAFSDDMILVR